MNFNQSTRSKFAGIQLLVFVDGIVKLRFKQIDILRINT